MACGTTTGISLAAQQVNSKLDGIFGLAQSTLAQALETIKMADDRTFPNGNLLVSVDPSGQLELWNRPPQPDLSDYDLDFHPPDGVNDNILLYGAGDISVVDWIPNQYKDCIDMLVDKLCDILQFEFTGLPPEYEALLWERARDRVEKQTLSQEVQIRIDFSARNWVPGTGIELARVDAIRQQGLSELAGISRDIAVEVFKEALTTTRLAMQLMAQFYTSWIEAFKALAEYTTDRGRIRLQEDETRIKRVEALMRKYDIESGNERARIQAQVAALSAEVDLFRALMQEGEFISQRDGRKFDLETRRREMQVQRELQGLDATAREIRASLDAELAYDQNINDLLRQVCAALWQAVNVAASMSSSSSFSDSTSCSESFSTQITIDQ